MVPPARTAWMPDPDDPREWQEIPGELLLVPRDRFRWPVGYFDNLMGQRIAFEQDRQTRSGVVRHVYETQRLIVLVLSDVAGVDELVGEGF